MLGAEMIWRLRALADFTDDTDMVFSTHISAHKLHFQESNALFCPLQVLGTYMVHICTCRQMTHTYKNKNTHANAQDDISIYMFITQLG